MRDIGHKSVKSVSDANQQLRFAIAVLQGHLIVSRSKGRLHIALILKDRLKSDGFWWQAAILESWIHRAQGGEFDV